MSGGDYDAAAGAMGGESRGEEGYGGGVQAVKWFIQQP